MTYDISNYCSLVHVCCFVCFPLSYKFPFSHASFVTPSQFPSFLPTCAIPTIYLHLQSLSVPKFLNPHFLLQYHITRHFSDLFSLYLPATFFPYISHSSTQLYSSYFLQLYNPSLSLSTSILLPCQPFTLSLPVPSHQGFQTLVNTASTTLSPPNPYFQRPSIPYGPH